MVGQSEAASVGGLFQFKKTGPSSWKESWGRLLPVWGLEAHAGSANQTLSAGKSSYHLVLKCHAFGLVFLEPGVRRIGIREDLEMIGVSDLLARIHVNEHGHRYP